VPTKLPRLAGAAPGHACRAPRIKTFMEFCTSCKHNERNIRILNVSARRNPPRIVVQAEQFRRLCAARSGNVIRNDRRRPVNGRVQSSAPPLLHTEGRHFVTRSVAL